MMLRAALICGVVLSAAGCGTPARLFLHPVATVAGTPADFGAAFEDVRMPRPGGGTTRAWWVPRGEDAAAVVLFGGNSGNRSHHLAYARMAWEAGFSVLMVDYQGFGPDNGEPDPGAFGQDAMASIDFASSRSTRVGVWGISLGSSVALLSARLRPDVVSAVCIEGSFRLGPAMRHYMAHVMPAAVAAPLADLTRALFIPGDADPERNLARLPGRVPVLFVHGDRDRLTRTVWGVQLFERTRGSRELWLMEDTGHAPEPLRSCEGEYAERIAAFFRGSLLQVPSQKAGAVWRAARVEDGWEVRADVVTGGPYPAAVEVVAVGDTEVRRVRLIVRRRVTPVLLTLREKPEAVAAQVASHPVVTGASWTPRLSPIASQHRALASLRRRTASGPVPAGELLAMRVDPVLSCALAHVLAEAAIAAAEHGEPGSSRALWLRAIEAAPAESTHFALFDAQYYPPEETTRTPLAAAALAHWSRAGWDASPIREILRALPAALPGE